MLGRKHLFVALLSTLTGCAASPTRIHGVEDTKAESADAPVADAPDADAPPAQASRAGVPHTIRASVGAFFGLLEPYGRWMETRSLGWIWLPDVKWVGPEFFPYVTAGRWMPTDHGWIFISDWPWGWVTFHYGRWLYDAFRGWLWVPGENWAPAWVAWRAGGGHAGWAPLPPRWHVPLRSVPSHFVFVKQGDLERPSIAEHLVGRDDLERLMRSTTPLTEMARAGDIQWYRGPSMDRASKPIVITPPASGHLVRARLVEGRLQLQFRGGIDVRAPVRSSKRPKGWRVLYRGAIPSIDGDVRPVMPPQRSEDQEQRWR